MKRFIQGEHRGQSTLLPESLDDHVSDTNPVRVVDVFVDELDMVILPDICIAADHRLNAALVVRHYSSKRRPAENGQKKPLGQGG